MQNQDATSYWRDMADKVVEQGGIWGPDLRELVKFPVGRVSELIGGAEYLRKYFRGPRIRLCSICNAKSGRCTENCAFCAQSGISSAQIEKYPLLSPRTLKEQARKGLQAGVDRFSFVTSGRRASPKEVQEICSAVRGLHGDIDVCASLGVLDIQDLARLKSAGLSRYHHNLEAAPEVFASLCTTHGLEERIRTVRTARNVGLSVCSGGVFGVGESDLEVARLGIVLRCLDVDAVPVNFLVPVAGTPVHDVRPPSPERCLKIIAMLRFILPDKEIIVCGGRRENLRHLQSRIFSAGASGMMTGHYLTVDGTTPEDDIAWIRELGLELETRN